METKSEISDLLGKTLASCVAHREGEYKGRDEILFETDSGEKYKMYHEQDCCEDVYIEDICGDLEDLIGTPILEAEESSSSKDTQDGSETWTYYKIRTVMGGVTIRWIGSSNGYYCERADFKKIGTIDE